jgi:hypothetical protein
VVTGNVANPGCGAAAEVGLSTMYTQIIGEVPVPAGQWHHLDIALARHGGQARAGSFLDHQLIARAEKTGIPLDKQGVPFTGIYPRAADGELVAGQLDAVRFGHGLFSLLDAFSFQHPGATPRIAPAWNAKVPLEADDSLAVEAAAAEFLEHLAYVARLNNRVNARSDRAIREHARNLSQSLRGGQWIRE